MKIVDLFNGYDFHDSLLDNIEYNISEKTVKMLIDFAFWAQDNYKEDTPETGKISVNFSDVDLFECPSDIDYDSISILGAEMSDEHIKFMILNDFTDESFWIVIHAADVTVEILN